MRLKNYKFTLKNIHRPQIYFHRKEEEKRKIIFISSATIKKQDPEMYSLFLTTKILKDSFTSFLRGMKFNLMILLLLLFMISV